MKTIPLLMFLAALTSLSAQIKTAGPSGHEREAAVASIRKYGIKLSAYGDVPEALVADMRAAKIIGIGEETHGTSESVTFNTSLVLRMAREHKVILSLEANPATVYPANDYLARGGDDQALDKALRELLLHNTQEFRGFLLAARAHNAAATPDRKIELYGVDPVNVRPHHAQAMFARLREYLGAGNTPNPAEWEALEAIWTRRGDPLVQTIAALRVHDAVERLAASTPGRAFELESRIIASCAMAHAIRSKKSHDLFAEISIGHWSSKPSTLVDGWTLRDYAIAQNIKLLHDAKDSDSTRLFYWAHNYHVGASAHIEVPFVSTGVVLRRWLGRGYYALGHLGGEGNYRTAYAQPTGEYEANTSTAARSKLPADSLNAAAWSASRAAALFFRTGDLAHANKAWPHAMVGYREVRGSNKVWGSSYAPKLMFNGVVWIPRFNPTAER